jgi:drug/metabolite transporter (DMT)-like permease
MNKPSLARGYLIAFIATVLWSTTAIFIGYMNTRFPLPPLSLAFWRDVIVASVLGAMIAIFARPLLYLGRQNLFLFIACGFTLGLMHGLWVTSVALNGAAAATVLAYTSPAFTALADWRWWGKRLGLFKIGAVLLSIVGCVLVSGAYDPTAWQLNPLGIIVGLTPGVMFAAYNVLSKIAMERNINPWTAMLYSFAFGAAFLLLVQRPGAFWLFRSLERREAALGWGMMILLAIGPTLSGYGLYTLSLRYLSITTANLVSMSEPAMTATWAFIFLGERLTIPQFFGAGLILIGVLFLRLSDRAAHVVG